MPLPQLRSTHMTGGAHKMIVCSAPCSEDAVDQDPTWTEASKLIGAFCRKASAGVSFSLLHQIERAQPG